MKIYKFSVKDQFFVGIGIYVRPGDYWYFDIFLPNSKIIIPLFKASCKIRDKKAWKLGKYKLNA